MKKITSLAIVGMLFVLTGCSNLSNIITTDVKLRVVAQSNLNLNSAGEALPVVLRIYQLADIQSFKTASFDDLWKADRATLGDSFIGVEEYTIHPSDDREITFEQADSAKFVAVLALFRDRSKGQWQVFKPLNDHSLRFTTRIKAVLSNNTISLSKVK